MKQLATWIGFIVGVAALLLQAYSTLTLRNAAGFDLFGAVVFFFTFYTILTNIMLVFVYLSEIGAAGWLGIEEKDGALRILAQGLGDTHDGDAAGHGRGSGGRDALTAAGGLAPGAHPGHSGTPRRTYTGFPSTTASGL